MQVVRLSHSKPQPASAEIFEGDVSMTDVLGTLGSSHLMGFLVTFRDGGRTVWHTHETDQVLVITQGQGIVETDAERRVVQAGDVVLVPGSERHWHGAEPGGEMAHLSFMTPGATTLG
jgi:quercetin dioxygenase-like cupin family protein